MRVAPCPRYEGRAPAPSGWRHRRRRAIPAVTGRSCGFSKWQQQCENRAPGLALELDEAAVARDELLGNRKTQPRTARAARHQGIEDARPDRLRHTGTVVLHLQTGDQAMACRTDADIRERTRAHDDASRLADRLQGVTGHIQQSLDHLVPVEHRVWKTGVIVTIDCYSRRRLGA